MLKEEKKKAEFARKIFDEYSIDFITLFDKIVLNINNYR